LNVNATVTDDDNRPVMQLGSEHFHIWEDKVEQQIKPYRIREVRSLQMAVDNPTVRWVVIGLVVLLLVPLVVMFGIMAMGAMSSGGMMSQIRGMMGGGSIAGMMSPAAMVLCVAWLALVAAALVFLIILLARSPKPPAARDKAA